MGGHILDWPYQQKGLMRLAIMDAGDKNLN